MGARKSGLIAVLCALFLAVSVAAVSEEWNAELAKFFDDRWEEVEFRKWPKSFDSLATAVSSNPKERMFAYRFALPKKEGKHVVSFKTRARETVLKFKLKSIEKCDCKPAIDGVVNSQFGPMQHDVIKVLDPGEHEFALYCGDLTNIKMWYKRAGRNSYFEEDAPSFSLLWSLSSAAEDLREARVKIAEIENGKQEKKLS